MLVVTRFVLGATDDAVPASGAASGMGEFTTRAEAALRALAGRPGYLRGRLARALDEPDHWCLVTEWESVGAYRRALSAFEVRLAAVPLLAVSLDEPSAYEVLMEAGTDGEVRTADSDRHTAAAETSGLWPDIR